MLFGWRGRSWLSANLSRLVRQKKTKENTKSLTNGTKSKVWWRLLARLGEAASSQLLVLIWMDALVISYCEKK